MHFLTICRHTYIFKLHIHSFTLSAQQEPPWDAEQDLNQGFPYSKPTHYYQLSYALPY
jgi:hypothetical protein